MTGPLPQPSVGALQEDPAALREEATAAEARDLADQERENRLNELRRSDRFGVHSSLLLLVAVYVLSGVAVLLIVDLAWNYAAPERLRFLDVLERADLQGFLSSGVLGGLLATGAGRLASMQQKR